MKTFEDFLKLMQDRNLKQTAVKASEFPRNILELVHAYEIPYNNGYFVFSRDNVNLMLTDIKKHKKFLKDSPKYLTKRHIKQMKGKNE